MAVISMNKKILVVDDEERMLRFIRLNLEHDGFQVVEAVNGHGALDKMRTDLPDLILLDIMLPDIDGFEVLKMVREISNIPVIMLTAKGEEDDRVLEVDQPALAVLQHALVEDLVEEVHHLQVGFLHLVKEHHRIGLLPHRFGQNAPFAVADVSGRRAL